MAGLAADDQRAGLAHKRAHMPDRTANDDGDALHRDTAARARTSLNDNGPAAARSRRRLRGVAAHAHEPAHYVLGEPGAGMAVHDHRGRRVHASAIVTDMAFDLDIDPLGDADSDIVGASGFSTRQ